jgi:hypothetical protein
MRQNLSEKFIEKWFHKLNWSHIAKYQKMSIDFIIKYSYQLSIDDLKKNKSLNQEELTKKEVYDIIRIVHNLQKTNVD